MGRSDGPLPPARRQHEAAERTLIEPLRLGFDVDCAPRHAFAVWAERIGQWWPLDHTVSADPGVEVVLEPWVGGRLLERTPAGDEIAWGEITVWEPPRHLGYAWHIRRDRADATDVEITFAERADGTTRVEIEHRGWERLGADGERWRNANRRGWETLLPHYRTAIESAREARWA